MLEELGIELWVGDPARSRKTAPRQQKTGRNRGVGKIEIEQRP
jgi:hypothetical protein